MRVAVAAPANNERSPRYMEKVLAAIHQAVPGRTSIVFEFGSSQGQVGLFVQFPQRIESLVRGPLLANYPQCTVADCEAETLIDGWMRHERTLVLSPEFFPILRHSQFEDLLNGSFADPINSVLAAVTPGADIRCRILVEVSKATSHRRHSAHVAVKRLDNDFFRRHPRVAGYFARHSTRPRGYLAWLLGYIVAYRHDSKRTPLDSSTSRMHDREDDLQAAADKVGGHLFDVCLTLQVDFAKDSDQAARDRLRQMMGAIGAFTRSRLATFESTQCKRNLNANSRFLLSHEELATLWHPPTGTVEAEKMRQTQFRELEAPTILPTGDETGAVPIGRVVFRQDSRKFGIQLEGRRRHTYIIGKTGMGKSTLMKNMLVSDIRKGLGVCLVDPHGDLAASLLDCIPSFRKNDVIYFDVADRDHPVFFNPLFCPDRRYVDQVTSGIISAFKKLNDSWGPRLEDLLRNAAFAIVEQRGNLLSMMRLLGDPRFREQIVPKIEDEVVRGFWQNEFARWSESYRNEAVAAIMNKVRPFVTNSCIRNIVTHPNRSLNLRDVMDKSKILIVNLSKGRIGEDNSTLLGAFLVTSLQLAAMTRADILEDGRRDFFVYVDEFQNFSTGSFATILSEARKYRVGIVAAHQYLSQLSDETAEAVWGNVGSILAFQVGSDDAEVLARQFSRFPGELTQQDFCGLPRYTAYSRLLVDGVPTKPFSLTTRHSIDTISVTPKGVRQASQLVASEI